MTPAEEVMERLAKESKALDDDKSALDKKLHYLETTYKNSKDSFESILKSAGGGG
jgi:prefoldin subunit 1